MERGTLTEVQTSAICRIVEAGIQRKEEKRLPNPSEQAYLTQGPGVQVLPKQPLRVQNVMDLMDAELGLRHDGVTRMAALSSNRLMALGARGNVILHFRFDQADLDVQAVDLRQIDLQGE